MQSLASHNTSPLYFVSFRANDDNYDRHRTTTTLHCDIAASTQLLFPALLSGSVLHSHEEASF
jgi:hypothetical protein